jgi:hypothetical protein
MADDMCTTSLCSNFMDFGDQALWRAGMALRGFNSPRSARFCIRSAMPKSQ